MDISLCAAPHFEHVRSAFGTTALQLGQHQLPSRMWAEDRQFAT
jgi:hypothetical protein